MTNDEERWIDLAEWRGQTISAMKSISNELREIKAEQKCLRNEFNRYNKNLTDLRVKVAGISATISFIVTVTMAFIVGLI